jgi:hypothetical protein
MDPLLVETMKSSPRLSNHAKSSPSNHEDVARRGERRSSGGTLDEYDTDYYGLRRDIMDPSEEGEEGVEDEDEPLSWRLDPSLSLSDWTVVIRSQDRQTDDEYHVHRNILAVGPSKSDYFGSLFRNSDRLAESESKTSYITLEDRAAKAFPSLLDFMYCPNNQLMVTTDTAIALRYLAQYFGVRLLFKKVMEFLREDMNLTNIHTYISDSMLFQDEKVTSFAAEKCVAEIQEISTSSPLLDMMDPHFFLGIVSSPEIDTCGCHLSALVAAYCTKHKDELDEITFRRMTDKSRIPLIDRDAALVLLELESDISGSDHEEVSELTCLQNRCVKVVALHWKEVSEKADDVKMRVFRKLPAPVLAELLNKSMLAAKQYIAAAEEMFVADRASQEKAFMTKYEEVNERRQLAENRVARMEAETKNEICRLRSEVLALKKQTELYKRELNRFERVPVDHSFADVEKSTYNRFLSGNFGSVEDDVERLMTYGQQRPSSMPRLKDYSPEDGYLVVENKHGSEFRWPVFFYRHEERGSDEYFERSHHKGSDKHRYFA